mgnify:CR=1 FL=1
MGWGGGTRWSWRPSAEGGVEGAGGDRAGSSGFGVGGQSESGDRGDEGWERCGVGLAVAQCDAQYGGWRYVGGGTSRRRRRQHSGVVIVCDGSEAADKRIARVLWNDSGAGMMRHADAGV